MRSDSDLRAAGQRAAAQPVPSAPPLSQLHERANKHRKKRRVVGSGLAALALVAVSVPVALNIDSSSTTVQEVVAGTGETAPAAQVEQPAPAAAVAAQDEANETSGHGDVRIEVRAGADFSVSIQVISGDGAVEAADAAAVAADETLDVEDGLTVWVARNGDQTTVSSLVEPTEFVEVTGSSDQLDKLIEVLRDGGGEWQGFSGFDWDHPGFGHGDFEFDLDFDGKGGPPDLEQFFEGRFGGDFAELEEFLNGLDGDFEGFDFEGFDHEDFDFEEFNEFFDRPRHDFGERQLDDLEQFFDDALPQIEKFFEDGDFSGSFNMWGEDFDGCISVHSDDGLSFEFPEGCSTS